MVGRPEMSTSCSFGMMAHLDRVGLTDSPCAGILVGEKGTKAKNVSGQTVVKKYIRDDLRKQHLNILHLDCKIIM